MVQQQIKLCGKEITVGYCFATEINFANFTEGDNAPRFIADAATKMDALTKGGTDTPDIRKAIYLILSAALAYYSSIDKELPIIDKDLMFCDDPSEIYTALGAVIILYGKFYKLIPSEAEKAKKSQKGSKGKN